MDINQDDTLDLLKKLSMKDFLEVGMNQVAYIRRYQTAEKETDNMYAIYAANGSQISVMDSYDTAIAAIRINDMFPVTLH